MGSIGAVISNPADLGWFVVQSVSELADLVARVISCAVRAIRDCVRGVGISFAHFAIHWLTDGSHFTAEIDGLKGRIREITQTGHMSALADALTSRVLNEFEAHFQQAKEIDHYFRPEWLKKMIGEDNESTFLGDVSVSLLSQHRELIKKTVEINILTLLHRFVVHIKELQEELPLFIVCFVKEALKEFSATIEELKSGERRHAKVLPRSLAKKLLTVFFPNGKEDLILPFSHSFIAESVAEKIKEKIWNELSKEGTVDILRDLFFKLSRPVVMNEMLLKVAGKVKELVNDERVIESEAEVNQDALQGVQLAPFNKAFSEAITAIVDYIDPDGTLRGVRLLITHARIESSVTPKVVSHLRRRTPLEVLDCACEELTPLLARPITILKTAAEHNRSIGAEFTENAEVIERLRERVDAVGKSSKGLLQIMGQSPSVARAQGNSFSALIGYLKKKGKEGGASFAAHQIRGLAKMAFEAYEPHMKEENVLLVNLASLAIKRIFTPH